MTTQKIFNFNHDHKRYHLALGISDEMHNKVRELILFHCFSTFLFAESLFDHDETTPRNLVTLTGVLERVLDDCDENEVNYALLIFRTTFDLTVPALDTYKYYQKLNTKSKQSFMNEVNEQLQKDKLKGDEDTISGGSLLKRCFIAEKNNHDFKTYYSELNQKLYE